MPILVDMNLTPEWVDFFAAHEIEAVHWARVGDPRARDAEVMHYAREHGYVVFTHDLDFGALLALTRAVGPSVLQVRTQNVLPAAIGGLVIRILAAHSDALAAGAVVTVDEQSARVRILPIR